jgi:deazaflavin-dependent oxidoreductase (nitroreductase family)
MNEPVITEFRARGGTVSRKYPVLLLTTTGARTGRPRLTPLNFSVDGDRLVVIASKGGSSTHPSWYHNLVANPEVTIELGSETFPARASIAEEPDRTRLFDQQAARMSFFDGYRRRVKARQIPVVVFDAEPASSPGRRVAGRPRAAIRTRSMASCIVDWRTGFSNVIARGAMNQPSRMSYASIPVPCQSDQLGLRH